MHQNHAAGQTSHGCRHLLVPAESAYVVHNFASGIDGGTRHHGFVSVHGQDSVRPFTHHIFNHRHNTAQLFFGRNAAFNHGRSGPRGLSANIQQVSAIIEHFERMGHGMVASQTFAPVRKRIRRNVQDAHHQRAGAKFQGARAQAPQEGMSFKRMVIQRTAFHGRDCIISGNPMPHPSSRAICILVLLPLLQLSAVAAKKPAKKDLAKEINAVLGQPPLNRAHWGIDIVDLDTGKALYSQNSDQLFLPASNAKLFTTVAALAIAGPEYRFRTTVEAEGRMDNHGRLLGDLVIVGRGDPNISGRTLPYALKTQRVAPHTQILEEMADQVAKSGLKIVDGDVIGDDTYYAFERYAEGWALDDLQWVDGAPVSALTFNDNVVFVNIQPGEQAGDKALITVEPETGYYELDNRVVTSVAGVTKRVGIHRDPGSKKITLWGTLPQGDAGMKEPLAIEDPAEFVAQLFRSLLEKRGITIRGKTRARHGESAQFFDSIQLSPKDSIQLSPKDQPPTPLKLPPPGIDNPAANPPAATREPGAPPAQ